MKLSSVVNRINGNVDRFTTDLKYYIGGEHFESNELAITKKGLLKENLNILGFKFHFAFQERDVIFMARNPHLRKAGMVMFSGLCSDASYILRSKDENILTQEFLAVQLQSDHFWDYCESHKVGSVNFANNWSSIANYEFDLPPIEVQRKIGEKVWAAYRVKESYKKLLAATDDMLKAKFMEMFGEEGKITLESIASSWSKGQSFSKNDIVDEGNTPCIHYGKLYKYGYVINNVFSATNASAKTTSIKGDILFPASDVTPKGLARCSCIDLDGVILGGDIIVMHPIQGINPTYLSYAINQQTNQLLQLVTGSVVRHMSAKSLKTVKVPLPPLPLQQQFVEIATQAEATKESLRKSIENIDQVIKSLINQ